MRLGVCTAVAVLALSFMAPRAAGEVTDESFDRFQLFNNCQPMALLVEPLQPSAAEIGLAQKALQNTVESRLRSARVYTEKMSVDTYLYLNVNIGGGSFGITMEFSKYLFDNLSDVTSFAITWKSRAIGTHGGDGSYILSSASQYVDEFLVEFLRVNEEACEKR